MPSTSSNSSDYAHRDAAIQTERDGLACIEHCYKPPNTWRVGIELERIGVRLSNFSPVDCGTAQVILRAIARRRSWQEYCEGGVLVGAIEPMGLASITLEPGAQMEVSTTPFSDLFALRTQLIALIDDIVSASIDNDVV